MTPSTPPGSKLDIVEVQFLIISVPRRSKERQYSTKLILRALTLIDNGYTKVCIAN